MLNDVGDVLGAITVAVPSNRFREVYPKAVQALERHMRDLNRALADYRVPEKA